MQRPRSAGPAPCQLAVRKEQPSSPHRSAGAGAPGAAWPGSGLQLPPPPSRPGLPGCADPGWRPPGCAPGSAAWPQVSVCVCVFFLGGGLWDGGGQWPGRRGDGGSQRSLRTRGRRAAPRGAGGGGRPGELSLVCRDGGKTREDAAPLPPRPQGSSPRPRPPLLPRRRRGRAVEFPQDGPLPTGRGFWVLPLPPRAGRPWGWGSGREGKPGDSAPSGWGLPGCACPEPHGRWARTGLLFIFLFFSPGRAGPAPLAWTLSPRPGTRAPGRVGGVLGAGPSRPRPHLHPPGPRLSRDEGGRGAEGRDRGQDGGPPAGGCLDNLRNRGQGLFRRRGLGFLPQSLPLGAGRRKGLDVAAAGPAGAAPTPPPSPRPEPWHPIHPAQASPRPDIPLRSVPTRRPPLRGRVSVCILAQALAPLQHLAPGHWPPQREEPPSAPSLRGAPCPQ